MLVRVEARGRAGGNQLPGALEASGLRPDQIGAALEFVTTRMGGELRRMALSRGGLADIVAALGDARFVGRDNAIERGSALLHVLFGAEHRVRALGAALAHHARIPDEQALRVLPVLVHAQFQALVETSRPALTELFARMPSLFQWSLGSMHADIADIIRRGCGAGPYGRVVLRRRVRAILAASAGYEGRSAVSWYVRAGLAPARVLLHRIGMLVR